MNQNIFFKVIVLVVCLSLLITVSWTYTILNHIFRWSLSTYILWLRVFGKMPSGNQHYWSTYMCINKQCSRVNTVQILIQMWHCCSKLIFFGLQLKTKPCFGKQNEAKQKMNTVCLQNDQNNKYIFQIFFNTIYLPMLTYKPFEHRVKV